MSGAASTIPVERRAFVAATDAFAHELEAELGRLDRDAATFAARGLLRFAVDIRTLQRRLRVVRELAAGVLDAAPQRWRRTA